MEEGAHRSSEALLAGGNDSSNPLNVEEDEIRGETTGEDDEQRPPSSDNGNDCTVETASSLETGESKAVELGTLASVRLSRRGSQNDDSTPNLSEVPVEYSLQTLLSVEELKVSLSLSSAFLFFDTVLSPSRDLADCSKLSGDQVQAIHKEPLKSNTGQPAQVSIQHLIRPSDAPSKLELSPISVNQSGSSILSPSSAEQNVVPVENKRNPCVGDQDMDNSPKPKPFATSPVLKASSDGYNWRKYGQKQVKSPEGFRSYYRCTFSDCYAKKIDCCDRTNHVIETVYRSLHNHDPPQKLNCSREIKAARPIMSTNGSNDAHHSVRCPTDPVPSVSSKENLLRIDQIPETKQQQSSGSDDTMEINFKDELIDRPECVNRQKRSSTAELGPLSKPGKKLKYVVHAAGDMGISGDGYRWRKYGQKMVKGNPHPRNYYRCTSAGCPVRKHIEKAVDNDSAVVITYKGVHDHDMPVPKKRHGSKSVPIVDDTCDSMDNLKNIIMKPYQSQTQLSMDKESDLTNETMNPGGKKTMETAQTLLNIEFEIKPN
ncbi:putative WRKY transcription factor 32 [Dorcoceras hygrometricum]|uniref:Putative WRKY transcription factor 32 n=1 Tax=Dorcoceras hygrometricum TaxID=472368 RepID=A0A2Z7C134_9LAMI|nr:putative WRKY transcription factor 32 [Dorcoceras hygrometricum]